jgi:hypothetical protein
VLADCELSADGLNELVTDTDGDCVDVAVTVLVRLEEDVTVAVTVTVRVSVGDKVTLRVFVADAVMLVVNECETDLLAEVDTDGTNDCETDPVRD